MRIDFVKYHGLGNDFAVIDARDLAIDLGGEPGRRLCDRFTGLGADGVLLWRGSLAHPEMVVVNADGSIAEMCGNGLRCVVKHLADTHDRNMGQLVVRTAAGPRRCTVERDAQGDVTHVTVEMGRPSLDPRRVPTSRAEPTVDQAFLVAGRTVHLTAIHTGNPHGVVFDTLTAEERRELGPLLGRHELFPAQANIEFVERLPDGPDGAPRLGVEVFERGCGWTRACGTGATAAAAAALHLGVVPGGAPVEVRLPGGWLTIQLDGDGVAHMRGPAVRVYQGAFDLEDFQ